MIAAERPSLRKLLGIPDAPGGYSAAKFVADFAALLAIMAGYWNVFDQNISFFFMITPLMMILFRFPRLAIYLIIINFMALDALTFYGLPRRFSWLLEFALVILFFRSLFEIPAREVKTPNPLAFPILVLIIFMIGGAIFREVLPVRVLLGFRFHYKFLLLGLACVWLGIEKKDLILFFKVMFVFALLQVPFTILQALSWGRGGDWCVGTFPPNTTNTFALWLVIMILAIYNFYSFNLIPRRLANLAIPMFIPLMLAWSRFSVLLMPFLIIFMFFINPTQRLGRRMRALFGVMLGFAAIFWASQFFLSESHEEFYSRLGEMYMLHARDPQMDARGVKTKPGKIRQFNYVMSLLTYELEMGQVFGFGIGEASESFFGGIYTGEAWKRYQDMTQYDGSQISWTLMEIGWVGFSLTLFLYIYGFFIALRLLRRSKDPFWQATSLAFATYVVDLVFSLLYTNVWDSEPLSFIFWFVLAGIIREGHILNMASKEYEKQRILRSPQFANATAKPHTAVW